MNDFLLEAAPGIIIGLIREVPPLNLKRRPAPNKWSVSLKKRAAA